MGAHEVVWKDTGRHPGSLVLDRHRTATVVEWEEYTVQQLLWWPLPGR
jgi:hypothetical protein